MTWLRRTLLTALPKVLLSRTTGVLARTPLPRSLRATVYGAFARRYGVDLREMDGELRGFRSLAEFFQRPLRDGARPIAGAALVVACDGRIVTSGAIEGGRIPQVKGVDYGLGDLLGDAARAARIDGGSQQTIYLAPGDYHRVHCPFDATITAIRALKGTLFPVNPKAVRAVPGLFVRNARVVFDADLADGRSGAIAMVGAFNVGDVHRSCAAGARLRRGDELGRFGFGSTVVCVVGPGGPGFVGLPPETVVRTGAGAVG